MLHKRRPNDFNVYGYLGEGVGVLHIAAIR
jgi:hypothetical protein